MKSKMWATLLDEPDAVVKLIFDHVRNLGIAAVTFGSGLWLFRVTTPDYQYLFMPVGLTVMVCGFALFALNQLHAMAMLERSTLGQSSRVAIQIICLAAVTGLVTALILRPR